MVYRARESIGLMLLAVYAALGMDSLGHYVVAPALGAQLDDEYDHPARSRCSSAGVIGSHAPLVWTGDQPPMTFMPGTASL